MDDTMESFESCNPMYASSGPNPATSVDRSSVADRHTASATAEIVAPLNAVNEPSAISDRVVADRRSLAMSGPIQPDDGRTVADRQSTATAEATVEHPNPTSIVDHRLTDHLPVAVETPVAEIVNPTMVARRKLKPTVLAVIFVVRKHRSMISEFERVERRGSIAMLCMSLALVAVGIGDILRRGLEHTFLWSDVMRPLVLAASVLNIILTLTHTSAPMMWANMGLIIFENFVKNACHVISWNTESATYIAAFWTFLDLIGVLALRQLRGVVRQKTCLETRVRVPRVGLKVSISTLPLVLYLTRCGVFNHGRKTEETGGVGGGEKRNT